MPNEPTIRPPTIILPKSTSSSPATSKGPGLAGRENASWLHPPRWPKHRVDNFFWSAGQGLWPKGPSDKKECRKTPEFPRESYCQPWLRVPSFSPKTDREERTIRIAAPLSIRQVPTYDCGHGDKNSDLSASPAETISEPLAYAFLRQDFRSLVRLSFPP